MPAARQADAISIHPSTIDTPVTSILHTVTIHLLVHGSTPDAV
jgi:hypothetical protein